MGNLIYHSDNRRYPIPDSPAELERCLADPHWRLFSGCLYKIIVKGDSEEENDFVMPFIPNEAQIKFLKRMWHRNIILKARQLGFTTLIAILYLDHALFNANQFCGIIAQDLDASEKIFRNKVKFAYDNLPEVLRQRMPLKKDSASTLLFAHNNSSFEVGVSMRSGTYHRLHISEFGKICAKYPDKAKEVMTGSIPTVPTNGVLVIESTAEGQQGDFYNLTQKAQAHFAQKKILTPKDYRFHFYAWWQEPKYRLPVAGVKISPADHAYFDEVEMIVGRDMNLDITIHPEQRAWYVATRDADFSGNPDRMWQEYPSYPAEAFQVSTDGNYYAKDMLKLRQRGGITDVAILDVPVNTFWDIGNSDGCAIWFHQEVNGQDRFIDYYEAPIQDNAETVVESAEFQNWVNSQPSYVSESINYILNNGSTKQVIEVLTNYKATLTPPPATPKTDDVQAKADDIIKNTTPSVPNSLSEMGGQTATDPMQAVANMSPAQMAEAMEDWTQEQIDTFMNRYF